jgi:hypothetical protein
MVLIGDVSKEALLYMTQDSNPQDTPLTPGEILPPTLGEILKKLSLFFVCGLLIIIVFSCQSSSWPQGISIVGVGFLIAGASLFSGMLIGFIFGIPRILSQESYSLESDNSEGNSEGSGNKDKLFQRELYKENSNLDQISDWLTKILVGVGLTQLIRVPAALQQYSVNIEPALGSFSSSGTFGVAILIFSSVDGFLIGYLWTRRCAAVEFGKGRSELQDLMGKVKKIQIHLNEVDERTQNDSDAIKLVQRVLTPLPEEPGINQEKLNEKIAKASDSTRAQICYLAMNARKQNWKKDKPTMERTIPIFRALIAWDTKNKYHNNYGQLGFALKDKKQPDWAEACEMLTKAINIRGPWTPDKSVFGLLYEYNRAICRINLDEKFNEGKSTTSKVQEPILKDISYADNDPYLSNLMLNNPTIKLWMELNNLEIQDYVHNRKSGSVAKNSKNM